MQRFEDLSPVERGRALETCRRQIWRYLAIGTGVINARLRQQGWVSDRAVWELARPQIEALAEEMARAAHYVDRGDRLVMMLMEVMGR